MWKRRTYRNSPNGRADVVVKVILDKPAHNARFPNSGVLEKRENTAMKPKGANSTEYKQNQRIGEVISGCWEGWGDFPLFLTSTSYNEIVLLHRKKKSMIKVSFRNMSHIYTIIKLELACSQYMYF